MNLEVEVGPGAAAGAAHMGNEGALINLLTNPNQQAAVVAVHTIHNERLILITPRKAEAIESLNQASRLFTHDKIDLGRVTNVIEASIEELQKVFFVSDSTIDQRGPNESLVEELQTSEPVTAVESSVSSATTNAEVAL